MIVEDRHPIVTAQREKPCGGENVERKFSRASFERTFEKCGTKEKSLNLNSIEKKKKIFYFYLFSPIRKSFSRPFSFIFRPKKGFFGCCPHSKVILFNWNLTFKTFL